MHNALWVTPIVTALLALPHAGFAQEKYGELEKLIRTLNITIN